MNHPKRQLLILGALVILAFYGALAFGTKTLTPAEIWHGFLARDFDIWQYRLPRAILAIYIGAALALSGTIIQGIIHNPLASPDILGINHGASLAAVLTLTFISNLPLWALPLAACLGAAAAFAILLALTRKNTGPLQMALIGVALFASAYMAEVVRGGLQAIPRGQFEAADSLGLGYWAKMRLVILPQALTTVIPGITNTFVGLFKDTTLVSIIGLYDFLGIVHSAGQDPAWLGHGMEGYAFCALVYFLLCYGMSHTSYRIERHFTPERA